MKLSFTTLGCPDWSFLKILEEGQKLGFEGIEIRGVDNKMLAEEIDLFFEENASSTKKLISAYNLKMIGFGTSVNFHDFGKYQKAITEGKNAIDVCNRMDIPFIRIFGDKIASLEERPSIISNVTKGIKELCQYAKNKNVKVLLEIHGDFNTIENVMEVVSAVKDCESFGILWDIEHSDKTYGDDWEEFYLSIKDYIKHVHIKDHLRINPLKDNKVFDLCLIGKGDIPIAAITKRLIKDGYDGYFSLEWEKKWHPELPDADIALLGYLKYMRNIE